MKKNVLLILLLFPTFFFSQKNPYNIYIDCFKNGDTISHNELELLRNIIIEPKINDASNKYVMTNCCFIFNTGKMSQICTNESKINEAVISVMKSCAINSKFYISKIKIAKTNSRNQTSYFTLNDVYFTIGNTSRKCHEPISTNKTIISYKGKLLTGATQKTPIENQKVVLKDQLDKEIQSTFTNKYGDFGFSNIDVNTVYNIEVPDVSDKVKDGKLFIAKEDGSVVRSMTKVGNSFVYKLLPIELTKLSEIEEDTEITLKTFSNSKNSQLTVLKDIQYEVNSAEITADAKKIIDAIVKSMKENLSLKLNIISHTDSRGDDNFNQQLSEKRAGLVMNYLISNGISKDRLSSKGMGETKVLNRCTNGVDCSEVEHKLNRRTEFVFAK